MSRRDALASLSAVLIAIGAAASIALFYLSQSTHVAALGYQINGLHAQANTLRAEYQQLTFQIGEARSPSSVERRARQELRLVDLDPAVVRFAIRTIDPHFLK